MNQIVLDLIKQQIKQTVHGVVVGYASAGFTLIGFVYTLCRGKFGRRSAQATVSVARTK